MIDPQREPLEDVVEVDQAEIPFRADNSFFDPAKSGKILIAGAVEVSDRGTNQAKPRRKRAKYLDTRSGRIRLAAIPDNSAASIEAFARANVKPGTTLLTDGHRSYPGLTDYRHDPRTVGKMAGHIVLPWIHRVFALMKRWGLGTYHGLRRKHIDTYLNGTVKLAESKLGRSRVARVNGRDDDDGSRPDLCRLSLPRGDHQLRGMAVFSVPVEPAHGRGDAGRARHFGDARDDPAVGP